MRSKLLRPTVELFSDGEILNVNDLHRSGVLFGCLIARKIFGRGLRKKKRGSVCLIVWVAYKKSRSVTTVRNRATK